MPSPGSITAISRFAGIILIAIIQMTCILMIMNAIVITRHFHIAPPEVKTTHGCNICIIENLISYGKLNRPSYTGDIQIILTWSDKIRKIGNPHFFIYILLEMRTCHLSFQCHLTCCNIHHFETGTFCTDGSLFFVSRQKSQGIKLYQASRIKIIIKICFIRVVCC
jgi:hypothetical protein